MEYPIRTHIIHYTRPIGHLMNNMLVLGTMEDIELEEGVNVLADCSRKQDPRKGDVCFYQRDCGFSGHSSILFKGHLPIANGSSASLFEVALYRSLPTRQ